MSYTFLQEQGAESLAESFSDIPAYVLLRLSLTAVKNCSSGNEMASCPSSQSGTTSRHLTEDRGGDQLTLFAGDSPARTSQSLEEETGLRGCEVDSGVKCGESLAKFDPVTFSWRTRQCLLFEDSQECLETLPQWGLMQDGELYPQEALVLLTSGEESGLWPTPRAKELGRTTVGYGRGLSELVTGKEQIPTPRASVIAASASMETVGNIKNPRGNLEEWVYAKTYPTPTAHMAKECNAPSESNRNEPTLTSQVVGGKTTQPTYLNPEWVEWLMNWPIGWTDLKPLATDKFRQWLDSHGAASRPQTVESTTASGKPK